MTTTDAALRQKVAERIRNYEHLVKKDVYRQHFHLMPPVGFTTFFISGSHLKRVTAQNFGAITHRQI